VFGIDSTEFLLIVIVAVVVIGPKDLPRALYKVGQVIGKAKAMSRHFRSGLDAMIREAELEELQKQWAKENERIMAAHPQPEVTEKPLVEGDAEVESDAAPSSDFVMEATAPIDPLVEAVKQSQAAAELAPAAQPAAHEPGKDAAA